MYAGEDIECIITFRNISSAVDEEEASQTPLANGHTLRTGRPNASSSVHINKASVAPSGPSLSKVPSASGARDGPIGRGHKPVLSLNAANGPSRGGLQSVPLHARTPHNAMTPAKSHGRSLSIISLGSEFPSEGRGLSASAPARRPGRGHGRSASQQLMPKSSSNVNAGLGILSARQPSPLYESTTPPALAEAQGAPLHVRPGRLRPGTVSAGNTPKLGEQPAMLRQFNAVDLPDFHFPAQTVSRKIPSPHRDRPSLGRSTSSMHSAHQRPISPRPSEGWNITVNPLSRVMSESSTGGTSRSSSDFYSISNHSEETIASEMPSRFQPNGRLLPKPVHQRQISQPYSYRPPHETLMMGYAQTMGHFILDGSLVNAAPFEQVKRKGVQGGGGVVGIEQSKRSSGMFGAFSWNSIGESLGGLLRADETSSIAQMKANAGLKSIPLLTTPQSLLFVDLRLRPGESRSYNYRFALPRGLPPSHRGRAMKVNYHLVIGVQRPGGQAVSTVEIPFRVLGSYNARGELLGHDLMSPYVPLQDTARTASITTHAASPFTFPRSSLKEGQRTVRTPEEGLEDFLRYSERLLDQAKNTNSVLLSPTSPSVPPTPSQQQSLEDQAPASIKDVIDDAILRSNHATCADQGKPSDAQSTNRFKISRLAHPVAVITLLRPAYRLGEAVIGTIDFTTASKEVGIGSDVRTYAVLAELESAERVDQSLALRSSTSIQRVTRKVHAALFENTIFARQISFALTIPSAATPTFETTGVNLVWTLRVAFTTQRQQAQGLGNDDENVDEFKDMLEELDSDERGTALIARERLMAETFEVAIPIKVYGSVSIDNTSTQSEALEVYI